jgi:hypothetical protein
LPRASGVGIITSNSHGDQLTPAGIGWIQYFWLGAAKKIPGELIVQKFSGASAVLDDFSPENIDYHLYSFGGKRLSATP